MNKEVSRMTITMVLQDYFENIMLLLLCPCILEKFVIFVTCLIAALLSTWKHACLLVIVALIIVLYYYIYIMFQSRTLPLGIRLSFTFRP
jgi:hypothetical protein